MILIPNFSLAGGAKQSPQRQFFTKLYKEDES